MERKKTAFSKLFDIVDGIENVVLAIMVILKKQIGRAHV